MNDEMLSSIRDPDLLEQVEKARGSSFYQIQLRAMADRQAQRDADAETARARAAALAALPRDTRRRAIIREVFENEPPSIGDVRHIHSVLAICALPYKRVPASQEYHKIDQGGMSMLVKPGMLMTPSGEWVKQPIPFGPKARLVLMHLCSEAVRQKSPRVEIADTFTRFVRDMGFPDSGGRGGVLPAFKEQLNALAACSMNIGTFNGVDQAKSRPFTPFSGIDLWLSDDTHQRSLWTSEVTFSVEMFESLKRHALPVNATAVRAFAGSARKLDIYFWLGYRLHNINDPTLLGWEALRKQFGLGFSRMRDFQSKFAEELEHIREVLPKLPVKLTGQGLSLQPAGHDVLALPAKRAPKKIASK